RFFTLADDVATCRTKLERTGRPVIRHAREDHTDGTVRTDFGSARKQTICARVVAVFHPRRHDPGLEMILPFYDLQTPHPRTEQDLASSNDVVVFRFANSNLAAPIQALGKGTSEFFGHVLGNQYGKLRIFG